MSHHIERDAEEQLAEANERLRREVAAHAATLRELEAARRDLETSVTERARELAHLTARHEIAIPGSNVTIFTQDRDLRYISISNAMFGLPVDRIIGRTDSEIVPQDSREAIVALKQSVLDSGDAADGVVRIDFENAVHWYDYHIEPLRDVAGESAGLTCAAVDITERKEGEAHLRLLMRELTHRSKNLLAVIQAMARQTARHSDSIDSFLDQFGNRLQALATSHDLLVQEGWYGASLRELVKSQLGHHIDLVGAQVLMDGPMVSLKPEAAQNLGLALHELATNAAKYGALSVPEGKVVITWRWQRGSDGSRLDVTWSEEGGPLVKAPRRRGFGTLVIERNLAHALGAEVHLEFEAQGVQCCILIPPDQLSATR